jgi:hypothetical protein
MNDQTEQNKTVWELTVDAILLEPSDEAFDWAYELEKLAAAPW